MARPLYKYKTFYDVNGDPWTFYHNEWQRTETIGDAPAWPDGKEPTDTDTDPILKELDDAR